MNQLQKIIVSEASKKEGFKEIKGNQGFPDEDFNQEMINIGFEKGDAWCSLFAEYVWKKAYQNFDATFLDTLDELFSKSAVKTFYNFKKAGWKIRLNPQPGDLVVWQKHKGGKKHWSGHIGVVINGLDDYLFYETLEGNSNSTGSREGIEVAKQDRLFNFTKKDNGLNLLGFIAPKI
jgi:hypothetical protein